MAYRSDVNARDKSGAIAAVIAIHAALLFAFLNLSGKLNLPGPQDALRIVDFSIPPPPPPPPQRQQPQQAKPKEQEGGSAPKNIRSQATPVIAPKPPKTVALEQKDLYEAVKNGQLPVIRLGRKIRVPKVALKRMLAGLPPDGPCTGNGRADNLRGVND